MSWPVGGGQFKLLLKCIYTNDDNDDNSNDNNDQAARAA